jgi:hypothetical protein
MKSVVIIMAAGLLLGACGSKLDPNAKNFGAALAQNLDKTGELCLGQTKWPVDVTDMDVVVGKSIPHSKAAQMRALEAAGLVSHAEAQVEMMGVLGKPLGSSYKANRYTLTDTGRQFYREKEVKVFGLAGPEKAMQGDLCYGKQAFDKVVKWEGPMKLGDYQEARVTYAYKIENLASWAGKSEVQQAFPNVRRQIEGAGKGESQHAVKLTSEGWEAL